MQKFIPLVDVRDAMKARVSMPSGDTSVLPLGHLADALGRPLHDLRISVTDRCNFRCTYCMPKAVFDKQHTYLPRSALLTFEEITRLARLFAMHGLRKIRLTGGEPLLRKQLDKLVSMLAGVATNEGLPLDLALTTNGSLLAAQAQSLKDAGLQRITVSLDALDESIFQRMNDVNFPVADVLHGLDVAERVGLGPIKINMVVKAGVNDCQVEPMARHFKGSPFTLRFIEYMDVGASNGWKMDEVVPSSEIVSRIAALAAIEPTAAQAPGETAQRWRYQDGTGEFGVISSVSQAFCSSCTRARLTTEGKLYTCLFATDGNDLRALLRTGCEDAQISAEIARLWRVRTDQYSALRTMATPALHPGSSKVEMSYIGG